MATTFWDARAPIYLIESPSAEDLYTGRNEGQSLVQILMLGEIEVNYFLVSDVERFKCAMNDIALLINERSDKDDVLPFVHISAHGSEDGIELTDGDCILWESLTNYLDVLHSEVGKWGAASETMDIPRCSLSLSSCSAFANYAQEVREPMPVQAILGPEKDVGWCQALLAFSSFYYQAFVSRQSFDKAVRAMNSATCSDDAYVFSLRVAAGIQKLAEKSSSMVLALRFSAADLAIDEEIVESNVRTLPDPGRHIL